MDMSGEVRPVADAAPFAVPAMPVVTLVNDGGSVLLLIIDRHPSVGWQWRPERKGGPCFLVGRETIMGDLKVIQRFPFTESGWSDAWRYLINLDPTIEARLRAKLLARQSAERTRVELAELNARPQILVEKVVLLGGDAAGADLPAGKPYDLRFLDDRMLVTPAGRPETAAEIPY